MAGRVEIRVGDLFSEHCDVIVLPSSRSGTITSRTRSDIETYRIPPPRYKKALGETELIDLPNGHNIARFVCWAASVARGTSTKSALSDIGGTLALYSEILPGVRIVSAPLMGSGAGGLDKITSVEGLAEGFLGRRPQSGILRLYERDRSIAKRLQDLVDTISSDFSVASTLTRTGSLTGEQFGRLQRALLESFSENGLRILTRIELEIAYDAIVGHGDLTFQIFSLISWAERNDRIVDLIRGARSQNPGNQRLREFAESMGID